MGLRILCIVVFLFWTPFLHSQEARTTGALSALNLGFGLGYHDTYNAEFVREHVAFSSLANFFLTENTGFNLRLEYSESTSLAGAGKSWWRDGTFGVAVTSRVTRVSALGAGVGADWIRFRRYPQEGRVMILGSSPVETIVIPPQDGSTDSFVRPSVYALASSSWPLKQRIVLAMEIRYKLIFVGGSYARTPYNTVNEFGITVSFLYDLIGPVDNKDKSE